MTTRNFKLPEPVRLRAESLGNQGIRWIAGLGESVGYLENAWSIRVGDVLTGGSESLVAKVLRNDGTVAILKLGLPGSADLTTEAKVFRLAAGRGYASLIEHDTSYNALLIEQLGTPLAKIGVSIEQQIRLICATLQDAWIPLESSYGLMTGAEKAQWLAAFITEKWEMLGRPCDKRTIDQALSFTEERKDAFSPDSSVLVHGDAHNFNALAVLESRRPGGSQYKFVDPDGLFAERACDLAVPMRDWSNELIAGDTVVLAKDRCELLAELANVEARAIWQWGFIERVSTGLVMLEIGMELEGSESLAVADLLRDA